MNTSSSNCTVLYKICTLPHCHLEINGLFAHWQTGHTSTDRCALDSHEHTLWGSLILAIKNLQTESQNCPKKTKSVERYLTQILKFLFVSTNFTRVIPRENIPLSFLSILDGFVLPLCSLRSNWGRHQINNCTFFWSFCPFAVLCSDGIVRARENYENWWNAPCFWEKRSESEGMEK